MQASAGLNYSSLAVWIFSKEIVSVDNLVRPLEAFEWAECSLIIGTGYCFSVLSLILDSSLGLSGIQLAGIQSARDSVPETLVRILYSAEKDNLSPFDSKIACLCQSIEINNKIIYNKNDTNNILSQVGTKICYKFKNEIEGQDQQSPKSIGIFTVLARIFVPNFEFLTSIVGELWRGELKIG